MGDIYANFQFPTLVAQLRPLHQQSRAELALSSRGVCLSDLPSVRASVRHTL